MASSSWNKLKQVIVCSLISVAALVLVVSVSLQRNRPPPAPPTSSVSLERSAETTVSTPTDEEDLPLWKTPNNFTWLFSAYYDDRKFRHSGKELFGSAVIVYGFQDFRKKATYYCRIAYPNGSQGCLSEAAMRRKTHSDGFNWSYKIYAYQYICRLPSPDIPKWVALVPYEHCHPPPDSPSSKIHWLPVQFDKPEQKKKFGICVETPAYKFTDPQLFPEFIEIHRLLGVEWFTIYIQSMGLKAREVLQEYVEEGLVELVEWNTTLVKGWKVHYYGQLLLTNDCLMRNMYKVEYLAFIDRDEVIVPYNQEDWHGMMKEIDRPSRGAFLFDHAFFHKKNDTFIEGFNTSMLGCSELHPPMYVSFHYRSKEINHYRLKTIVKPDKTAKMEVHWVTNLVYGYEQYFVPRSVAIQHHYRNPDYTPKDRVILDTTMAKFVPPLLNALNRRLCPSG